ncbi:siderophore-interacting protein [Photobacterium makurazakiensis]|uniref:siderophore-interacting protein n=1 Tax=Photobacterium makurazakiensis TaxID=2910234 RepID=UPI003D10A815
MNKKPQPKTLTVLSNTTVTPNMQRITLGGNDISLFPADSAGQYVKLMFTAKGETNLSLLAEGEKAVLRTFTVGSFDQQNQSITLDLVRHDSDNQAPLNPDAGGYAARWAQTAAEGDTITIGGPKPIQSYLEQGEWFLMIGDMTSLTALKAKLSALPKQAKGYVVVNVTTTDDMQILPMPEGMKLVVNSVADSDISLAQNVKALEWLEGDVSVWCACEFSMMRELRSYVNSDKGVARKNCYFSSYWKEGVTEDGHKVIKRQDAESLKAKASTGSKS